MPAQILVEGIVMELQGSFFGFHLAIWIFGFHPAMLVVQIYSIIWKYGIFNAVSCFCDSKVT